MKTFTILLPFLFGFSAFAGELPLPQVETLPNGLEVVWFVNDRLPIVDLDLIVKSGSRDDLPGKSGTSELVSATLERGAGGLDERQIAQAIESLGASRAASTDDDYFHVTMHGLAGDAGTLLDLLAKVVVHPDFPEAEVKREKARILDGWSRLSEYGESLVDLAYRRAMTQGTPYARGGMLSAKEFAHVEREDVLNYYRRNFTPKNSLLMIVGRVDQKKFRDQIVAVFGGWAGDAPEKDAKKARHVYTSLPVKIGKGEVIVINRPDLTQAQVRIGFPMPAVQDPRHYPLAVGNALLGEYFHSRLNTLIRDQLGLTYGISSSFSFDRDLSILTITSATRNDAVAQLIQKAIDVLKGLKAGPIPAEEVQTAKDYLVGGFPLSNATLDAVAARWVTNHLFGLSPNRLNEYVPGIEAVKPEQVLSAVSSAIDLSKMTIAVAGDVKVIAPVLKKAGFKLREIPVASLVDGTK